MRNLLLCGCLISSTITGMVSNNVETLRSLAVAKILSDDSLVEKTAKLPDISDFAREKALKAIKQSLYPFKITNAQSIPIQHRGVCALVATEEISNQIISIGCDGTIGVCSDTLPYFCQSIPTSNRWHCACLQERAPMLCLGDISGNIGFMNAASQKPEPIFKAHQQTINSLSLSPDQQHLISSSNDTTIGLWDINTKQSRGFFKGHTKAVRDAFCVLGYQKIVSAGADRTIRLWDIEREEEEIIYDLQKTLFQRASVFRMARHPHEQYCVSGLNNGMIVLWDIRLKRFVERLKGHSKTVSALICSGDGNYIASGSWGGTARIWDMRMMACSAVLAYHEDWVQSLTCLKKFSQIVSGTRDGKVKITDISSILAINQMNDLKSIVEKYALVLKNNPISSKDRLDMLRHITH